MTVPDDDGEVCAICGAPLPCSCAKAACRHWVRKGFCSLGNACAFAHDPALRGPAEPRRRTTRRREKLRESNASRAACLRRFVLETVGAEALRGGGVIDVAGGKGELSLQFCRLNAVPVTLVDPRLPRIKKYERKLREGRYTTSHSERWASDAVVEAVRAGDEAALKGHGAKFCHVAAYFEALDDSDVGEGDDVGLPAWCRATRDAEARFAEERSRALASAWTAKGLVPRSEVHPEPQPDETVVEVKTADEARRLFTSAAAIVGLHPDAAAEPIVDFALRRRIPFFVVPCCVYSELFPKRRGVRSYEDLVDYLRGKHPEIRSRALDGFDGRNTVVYWVPARR